MENADELFTVREVAQELKLTEKFVRAEIGRKRLGAHRMGGEYRISRRDIEAYKKLTYTRQSSEDENLAPVA